jgi:hypothetical protein
MGMKTAWTRTAALVAALVSLLVAWACVIWVALQVSTIVLKTLEQIVDLAQMS